VTFIKYSFNKVSAKTQRGYGENCMPETSQPLLADENDEISLPIAFQKSVEKPDEDEETLPMVFKSPMEKSDVNNEVSLHTVLENSMEKSDEEKDGIFLHCIMCNKQFNRLEIERHVNNCIDKVEKTHS